MAFLRKGKKVPCAEACRADLVTIERPRVLCCAAGCAEDRNPVYRSEMEDAVTIAYLPSLACAYGGRPWRLAVLAVFDGHGGRGAARWAGLHMPHLVASYAHAAMEEVCGGLGDAKAHANADGAESAAGHGEKCACCVHLLSQLPAVLDRAFTAADAVLVPANGIRSGATAVAAVVAQAPDGRVWLCVANAGDSGAVLAWRGGSKRVRGLASCDFAYDAHAALDGMLGRGLVFDSAWDCHGSLSDTSGSSAQDHRNCSADAAGTAADGPHQGGADGASGSDQHDAASEDGEEDAADRLEPGAEDGGKDLCIETPCGNDVAVEDRHCTAEPPTAEATRRGHFMELTQPHRADDTAEVARVRATGGVVFAERVGGMLAVTRSLGDHDMGPSVSARPRVALAALGRTALVDDSSLPAFLQPPMWLVLACDGVWDVCSEKEVADILLEMPRHAHPNDAAGVIVRHALGRGSMDNVSVLVARIDLD